MKLLLAFPAVLLGTLTAVAQPAISIGPRGVEVDPGGRREYREGERREPREERIVRQEGGCRVTIVRRFDETGRRVSRRTRECEDDGDE